MISPQIVTLISFILLVISFEYVFGMFTNYFIRPLLQFMYDLMNAINKSFLKLLLSCQLNSFILYGGIWVYRCEWNWTKDDLRDYIIVSVISGITYCQLIIVSNYKNDRNK